MAATVEGIFRIIDRASAPMARMERQAKQTDRAIKQLGMTTDMVGTREQQMNITKTERAIKNFGTETDRTTPRVKKLNRDLDHQNRLWVRMRDSVTKVGAAIAGLGRILKLLMMPALAAGIGVVVQAVGALAGGIVALLPRIGDLGGAVLALGPVVAGLGLAMVTTKLAFKDFGKALGGNKEALKNLTPDARAFLVTLKQYAPVMKELRTSAQSGIFGGLDFALRRAQRALPVVNQLLRDMSTRLGALAGQAGARFTTPGFLQDILGIGQAGGRAVSRGGAALLNIASALRHLTAAAIPFTDWLTKGLVSLSKFVERWALFQRDSGGIERWLNRTKDSLRLFGNILKNVWEWVGNLLRAARPLGDRLWKDAEKATRAWAQMTGTMGGQIRLMRQFNAMYPAIKAIFELVTDLGRAIFRMGAQSGGVASIADTLKDMIPSLERLLNLFAATLGPPLVNMLKQAVRLLENLAGVTGPVSLFLNLLGDVLKIINDLIDKVPWLGRVLTTALSILAIGLFIGKVRALATSWWLVVTGARAAAGAQAAALGVGGAGMAGGVGRAAMAAEGAAATSAVVQGARYAPTASGLLVPTAQATRGISSGVGIGAKLATKFPGTAARLAPAAARMGALGTAGMAAARGIGKFALPVTALMAGYDAYRAQTDPRANIGQQGLQRFGAALSGASFGIYQAPQTGRQQKATAASRYFTEQEAYKTGGGRRLGMAISPIAELTSAAVEGRAPQILPGTAPSQMNQSMASRLRSRLEGVGGQDPQTYKQLAASVQIYKEEIRRSIPIAKAAGEVGKDGLRAAREELHVRQQILRTATVEREGRQRAGGMAFVRGLGQAHNIYAAKKGDVGATWETNKELRMRLEKASPAEKRVISERYIEWLNAEKKRNPALEGVYQNSQKIVKKAYDTMGVNIKIRQGAIHEGTKKQWNQIASAMTTPVERARQATMTAFTQIQNKALGTLEAMGYSASTAKNLVRQAESGGAGSISVGDPNAMGPPAPTGVIGPTGKATGGRIGGHGRGDHIGLGHGNGMAAPGELIVNRHTERRINKMLGGRTSLGREVEGETLPHSFAKGGRTGGGIQLPSNFRSTHNTDGLSGFPAIDVFGTPGTPVYAPEAGTVARPHMITPNAAKHTGGGTMYLEAAGRTYFLTHFGSTVPAGPVGAGGFLGTVGSGWGFMAPHIHEGLHGGAFDPGKGGGGGTGPAAAMINMSQLYSPSGVGGAPGATANAARKMMAAGMAAKLNGLTGAVGGVAAAGMPPGLVGPTGPVGGGNQGLAHALMMKAGFGADQWPALRNLWNKESGFRTTASNASSGAYGIPQALPGNKMASAGADWATNPATQIRWGLNYIKDRYGSPAGAWAHSQATNWYGDGGDFIAKRPQVIGVGDKGAERVTVTPVGKGRGGGGVGGLTVHIANIENHREGDVVKIIHQEMALLARDLEQGVFGSDADGVLA